MSGQILSVRQRLILCIFAISAISYLDRNNMSIAGLKIMQEFRLSQQQLGYFGSAFLIGYAGFQVPAGWLAARLGPRKVLAFGLLWWCLFTGAITLLSPLMGSAFAAIAAVRFVLGVGESVTYPSANQFISAWIPKQERGKANGWVFAGVGVGAALTPPLVTWIMTSFGWRAAFWGSAVIGLIACLVWYASARDRPEQHPSVSPSELAHIKAGLPQDSGVKKPVPWRRILGSRNVWALSLAYWGFGYTAYIFLNWFFIYLATARGLDLKSSALLTMLPFLTMIVCCIAGGGASDFLARTRSPWMGRSLFSAIFCVATALFLVLGSRAGDAVTATIVLALGAGSLYVGQNCYWAVSADLGGDHAGVVSGVMNMVNQLGGAVTTSLTPFIAARYGWAPAFYVAAGFALLSALAWLMVDPGAAIAEREKPAA